MTTHCVVFTCNLPYFDKFIYTLTGLVTNGKYNGPICLVIGDDLVGHSILDHPLLQKYNVIIKHFPNIKITREFLDTALRLKRPPHWCRKLFQFHKLHLFNVWFKQWENMFYIDCGITIFSDISPIICCAKKGKLIAHSDAYDSYVWKLHTQFDMTAPQGKELLRRFNMNVDYCQSTIMLYDTSIIEDTTFDQLYSLMNEFPNSITNDQGIIALYFTNIQPIFEQIKIKDDTTYYYDYLRRVKNVPYIMLKLL
jgi:hypothetical protein